MLVATFLLLLGVEAMLLFWVSCQLPLRTHCAPILSNTTSAGVVNTTEEKVPNYCFYNTHTWVKRKEKSVGENKKVKETKRVEDKRRILYVDFSKGDGGTKLPFPKHIFEKRPTHFSPSPCRNFSSAQSSPGYPPQKTNKIPNFVSYFLCLMRRGTFLCVARGRERRGN